MTRKPELLSGSEKACTSPAHVLEGRRLVGGVRDQVRLVERLAPIDGHGDERQLSRYCTKG